MLYLFSKYSKIKSSVVYLNIVFGSIKMKDKHIIKKEKKKKHSVRVSKSPNVSRSRGYYGFSSDFPGEADEKGFRNNTGAKTSAESKKRDRKFFTFLFACVFIASFVLFYTGFSVSRLPAEDITKAQSETVSDSGAGMNGRSVFISYSKLYSQDIDKLCTSLKEKGVTGVIIDVKDPAGYLAFRPSDITRLTSGALKYVTGDFASAVRKFDENSISVSALFSCYADTFASSYLSDYSVRNSADVDENGNRTGALWYNDTSDSYAWLDPFTDGVDEYLDSMISYVADAGVNEIILNSVCLPVCSNFNSAVFSDGKDMNAVNERMTQFVKKTIDKYSSKTAVSVFVSLNSVLSTPPAGGYLLNEKSAFVYVDMRLSKQPDNMKVDSETFEKPSEKPYMFISNAAYACGSVIAKSQSGAKMVPLIESNDASSEQAAALMSHEINYFALYSADSDY